MLRHYSSLITARVLGIFLIAFVIGSMIGCASFGVDAAKGFRDNVAIAQTTNTSLVKSFGLSASLGKLSKVRAQDALRQVDTIQQGIDVAIELESTDVSTAKLRLQTASAAIKALQAYLLNQQKQMASAKDSETSMLLVGLLGFALDQATAIQALFEKAHSEDRQVTKEELLLLQRDHYEVFVRVQAQVDAMP